MWVYKWRQKKNGSLWKRQIGVAGFGSGGLLTV
jgi:hypothetical protein